MESGAITKYELAIYEPKEVIVYKKPKKDIVNKEPEYIYTITDAAFEDFKIMKTANAWWLDRRKVENLIAAYKFDCTDEEACAYAGIRIHQLRYFRETHPDFSQVKEACKQLPTIQARNTVVNALRTDPKLAMDYLERKRKSEFGKRDEHIVIPQQKTLEDFLDEMEERERIREEKNGQ